MPQRLIAKKALCGKKMIEILQKTKIERNCMKRFFLLMVMITLIILACSGALAGDGSVEFYPDPAKITFEEFNSPEGMFSVSVPSGWKQIDFYPYKTDDTVNGIMLEGPENFEGAPMTIAVLHYAGAGWIKGPEHYIKMLLSNPTRIDGEKEIKFSGVTFGGKKGTTFIFKKFQLVMLPFDPTPMEEGVVYEVNPPTRKVTMIVRHIIISENPGFYSLWFEAPEDRYEEFSGVFDTVAKSFVCRRK
jgi:hypothetical protein